MVWCDRGVQMLLTTVGAFAAFSLMTIAIGTDYWLYSSANICNGTNLTTPDDSAQSQPRKVKGDHTHSGLWRICCIEGRRAPRAGQRGWRGRETKKATKLPRKWPTSSAGVAGWLAGNNESQAAAGDGRWRRTVAGRVSFLFVAAATSPLLPSTHARARPPLRMQPAAAELVPLI